MAEKWSPLIEEFVGVTGASRERAESMLEACNGNLGMAIEMHFDSCTSPAPVAGNSSDGASSSNNIDK